MLQFVRLVMTQMTAQKTDDCSAPRFDPAGCAMPPALSQHEAGWRPLVTSLAFGIGRVSFMRSATGSSPRTGQRIARLPIAAVRFTQQLVAMP